MSLLVSYVPPRVNAALAVHEVLGEAAKAAADVILDASQPGVPVEEGVLKASGRVVPDGISAVITYGHDNDGGADHAPSNQYAIKQHEDMTLNHPNGGGAKWLEQAMHTAGGRAIDAAAATLHKALG